MNIQTDPPPEETERIRQWRTERAAVAEAEKQDRIRKAAEERDRQLAADTAARQAQAAALLPDNAAITAAQNALHTHARRKSRILALQLMLFVLLPTLAVVAYLALIATPLYEARAVVLIAKPSQGDAPLGGLLGSLSGQSTLSETFMAQEFIRSQDMMDQLEEETGLITALSGKGMDPLRRLRDLPALRLSKQDQFARFVDAAINIQTGLLTLYVRTPDPAQAIAISQTVLDRTAARITDLSEDLFDQRLTRARAAVAEAQAALAQAQTDLIQFQITTGETNPQARIDTVFATIQALDAEKQGLANQMQELAAIGGGKPFQKARLDEMAAGLDLRIAEQRRLLVDPARAGGKTLNALLLDHEMLVLQVRVSEEALTQTRQALAAATDAAALGRSTFQIVVPPKTSEHASAPNVVMSGLVALVALLGLFSVAKLLLPSRPFGG